MGKGCYRGERPAIVSLPDTLPVRKEEHERKQRERQERKQPECEENVTVNHHILLHLRFFTTNCPEFSRELPVKLSHERDLFAVHVNSFSQRNELSGKLVYCRDATTQAADGFPCQGAASRQQIIQDKGSGS